MQIMRQTIIIPNENKVDIPIYSRTLQTNESHSEVIKEFSDEYHCDSIRESTILLDNDDPKWYIECSKLGHLVICQDEILKVYLPPIITIQQLQYLLSKKEEFLTYDQNLYVHSWKCFDNRTEEQESYNFESLYRDIRDIQKEQKHIIIIPNEEELVIPKGIYQDSFNISIGHAQRFKSFNELYHLGIMIDSSTVGHEVSIQLANFGHFTICIEDNSLVCYIPDSVSNNQKCWFSNNHEFLIQYEIKGFYFDGRMLKTISDNDSNQDSLLEIQNKINEKYHSEKQEPIVR